MIAGFKLWIEVDGEKITAIEEIVQLNLLNWARNIFDRLTQLELFLKPSLTYADLMEITHSP